MDSLPGLSVVIVNWNTANLLDSCLRSIAKFPYAGPQQIIVVDNNSSDNSAQMVRDRHPSVELIAETTNWGYAKGNNIGFRSAKYGYLLTLNPDTEVFEDTLDRAVSTLRVLSDHAALSARQIDTLGDTQQSVRGFPTFLGIVGQLTRLDRLFPSGPLGAYTLPDFDYDEAQEAPQPMGTFILFSREKLDLLDSSLEPFDEQFPIFFNEVDLLYRLYQRGFSCWYEPSVRILHHGGAGTKQVRKNMIWESHKSLVRYFQKHASTWQKPLIPLFALFVYVGALIRARGYYPGFRR
ncbi:MAG: glycosyltransferase family 2 protein [Armatimonadetes bacterium]|nr:glycosyltransferase family 2 protein [Armatimonadota bacterium]